MDIKHRVGEPMTIVLNPEDIERLRSHQACETQFASEGVMLRTVVARDEFTTEPIAETDGHHVRVYLPLTDVTLPIEVPVHPFASPAARFYFGETGKICLVGEVELDG